MKEWQMRTFVEKSQTALHLARPEGWILPVLLSIFFCAAGLTGCKKAEDSKTAGAKTPINPAETNRFLDAAYNKDVNTRISQQQQALTERGKVQQALKTIEDAIRIKEALPKDAPQEAVLAAFKKNPEWVKLQEKMDAMTQAITNQAKANADAIRARLMKEAQAKKTLADEQKAAAKAPAKTL
jgi:hypothetical protein